MVAKFIEEALQIGIRLLRTKGGKTLVTPLRKKKRAERSVRSRVPRPTSIATMPLPLEPTAMPTERPRPTEEHYDTVDADSMGQEWLARATDATTLQEDARAELGLVDPSAGDQLGDELGDEGENAPPSSDSQWEAAFQYVSHPSGRMRQGPV